MNPSSALCPAIPTHGGRGLATSSSVYLRKSWIALPRAVMSTSCVTEDPNDYEGEDGGPDEGAPALATTKLPPSSLSGTLALKPSRSLQDQDPDRGINRAYCVCDGIFNYPELPWTSVCAYASLPLQTTNEIISLSVFSSNCQLCTHVNIDQSGCTSVPRFRALRSFIQSLHRSRHSNLLGQKAVRRSP